MQLHENLVVADRFRLVRMIGRGGMGSIWQAVQLTLDQPCAVKFIEGELTEIAYARFEREAKAAAQIRSPHVVQVFEHGVCQGRPYIAMELLDGEDLGRVMERSLSGKLPLLTIASVVDQVCRGLTAAHRAGVVHRDLKPDNIFLVNDDDRQLVKILDFGVAKSMANGQAIDASNTKTGAMLGTPYYMSPEQAQGIKTVDSRSDLWSLAVIVYQCVTGRRPFESEALGDLLVKIIVQPIPIPSLVAEVPQKFDHWWARAAARDPDRRFQTAKEFASSLMVALGVSPIGNADPTSSRRATPRGQRTAMMTRQPPTTNENANAKPNANANANANAELSPSPPQHKNLASTGNTGPHLLPTSTTPTPNKDVASTAPPQQQSVLATTQTPPRVMTPTPHGVSLGATVAPAIDANIKHTPNTGKGAPIAILAGIGGVMVFGLVIGSGVVIARRVSGSGPSEVPSAATTTPPSSVASTSSPTLASVSANENTDMNEIAADADAAITPTSASASASSSASASASATVPTKPASKPSAASSNQRWDDRKW